MKNPLRLLPAVILLSHTMSAEAQAPPRAGEATGGIYAGIDVGISKLEASSSALFFGPDTTARSGDDTGFAVRVGVQFSRHFALELGYIDFGQFTARDIPAFCPGPLPAECRYDLESSTNGPVLSLVGTWPLGERWFIHGKLGALHAQVDSVEQESGNPASRTRSSADNTAFHYGLGVGYELTDRASLNLDWAKFDQLGLGLGTFGGPAFFDLGSSSLLSVGVTWQF